MRIRSGVFAVQLGLFAASPLTADDGPDRADARARDAVEAE